MCGISAILEQAACDSAGDSHVQREADLLVMLGKIRDRGDPERFGEILIGDYFAIGTNRLAIVDRDNARQPCSDAARRVHVVFNGEIYNHGELREELLALGHVFRTTSDTEVITSAYIAWGPDFIKKLDGIFAFVVVDERKREFLAARDHIGIKPLYYAQKDGRWFFASEQKSILPYCRNVVAMPPGSYLDNGVSIVNYFNVDELTLVNPATQENEAVTRLQRLLRDAVYKQVKTDLPIAVMFSGGIDSSIILHLARQYHPNVTAITVGLRGAADVAVAQRYCSEHRINHIVRHIEEADLIEAIPKAVYGGEFFECIDIIDTCIAYFGYREAWSNGFKVALCGEGSDEIFAGYDLFRQHPSPFDLMRYRVRNLHRTDLQRVDRASMMNSVEARVPFLDRDLLTFAYTLPMDLKLRGETEKWILREAFRDVLPDYIVNRPKVRMPDGSGVKNTLMDYAGQRCDGGLNINDNIEVDSPQAAYFLWRYLDAGFPPPKERHRRLGFDYYESGYFRFVS